MKREAGREPGADRPRGRLWHGLAARLFAWQLRRPWMVVALAVASTLLAGLTAMRLTLHTGLESLLPESRPSVVELRRVSSRIAGVSSLFVVLEGGQTASREQLRQAGDAVARELTRLGPPWVGSATTGVHEAERFLEPRAGLYASREGLEQVYREVKVRYDLAVADAVGALVDDEPLPPLTVAKVKSMLGLPDFDGTRFPDGYFQSADGKTLVVAVYSQVPSGEFTRGADAVERIRAAVARVDPTRVEGSIRWGFAGDLASGVAEYEAIRSDLEHVGMLGAALLALVVFLYYLRLRPLLAMLLTVLVGESWTFAVAALTVGHLNAASGFLFSVVAGNGINSGILLMARYLEERHGGKRLDEALRLALRHTWLPTLTAACAAAAAYGSLGSTDFRGFRDFGFIGGAGMLLCWCATYLVLPSILVLLERAVPVSSARSRLPWRDAHGGLPFGAPFAALASRWPRAVVLVGAAVTVLGVAVTARYALNDPMEYDVRRIRSDLSVRAEEARLNRVADQLTGFAGLDAMAILVDRPEQIAPLRSALLARRDAAPAEAKPFGSVFTLQDFVPEEQQAKLELLGRLRKLAERARARGAIDDATWAEVARYLPPDLAPFGIAELPAEMARPFTEADGTRGRLVYLSPIAPGAVDDAHYLFRWADAYRETRLPDGSVVLGSGRAVVYADLFSAVLTEVPRAVALSLLATLLVVAVAFRARLGSLLLVLGSLLVGVAWMGAALALSHVRLNFLNFIALPVTFGIGVDYAVNVVQRYRLEGGGGALRAVRATGGAVVLCSLTTMVGYLSLAGSNNAGIRSLGLAAALGEICCLAAAVLVLPAVLVWRDQRCPAPSHFNHAAEVSHG